MDLTALALAAGLTGWTPPAVTAPKPLPVASMKDLPAGTWVVASPGAELKTWDKAIGELAQADLVCAAEKHDELSHHLVQAEAVMALAARRPNLAIGLEMVAAEDQGTLDDFAAGRIGEEAFAAWWKKSWGFDYSLYKPIFDAAKARGLPVHGLNAPKAVVREVAKKGLSGLSASDRARLPAKIEESSDPRYRKFVEDSISGHGAPPQAVARMAEAMAVWNETMGENAAKVVASGRPMLVIAGQGHCFYGAGIPESAARRGVASKKVLLPYPLEGGEIPLAEQVAALQDPGSEEISLGDYFRLVAP